MLCQRCYDAPGSTILECGHHICPECLLETSEVVGCKIFNDECLGARAISHDLARKYLEQLPQHVELLSRLRGALRSSYGSIMGRAWVPKYLTPKLSMRLPEVSPADFAVVVPIGLSSDTIHFIAVTVNKTAESKRIKFTLWRLEKSINSDKAAKVVQSRNKTAKKSRPIHLEFFRAKDSRLFFTIVCRLNNGKITENMAFACDDLYFRRTLLESDQTLKLHPMESRDNRCKILTDSISWVAKCDFVRLRACVAPSARVGSVVVSGLVLADDELPPVIGGAERGINEALSALAKRAAVCEASLELPDCAQRTDHPHPSVTANVCLVRDFFADFFSYENDLLSPLSSADCGESVRLMRIVDHNIEEPPKIPWVWTEREPVVPEVQVVKWDLDKQSGVVVDVPPEVLNGPYEDVGWGVKLSRNYECVTIRF